MDTEYWKNIAMPKRQTDDIKFLAKGRIEVPGLSLTEALAQKMKGAIENGELVSGVMLPPLRKLAERHEVGIITVKKAIEKLVDSGLVESLPRVGYRISNNQNVGVKKIGIIYRNLHFNKGSSQSIDSIEKSVRSHNQVLMVGASHGNTKEEDECIKRFRSAGMDGLIIAPAFEGDKSIELEKWINDGKAIVLEGHPGVWKLSTKTVDKCPLIDFDNYAGMTLMMEYLWSLGHKNILYASGDKNPKSIRLKSYLEFMKLKGIKPDFVINNGSDLIKQILKKSDSQKSKVSAVLCTDDDLAFNLIELVKSSRSKKGAKLSIAGFGNQGSKLIDDGIKLTTINFPLDDLANKITDLLNRQFSHQNIFDKNILIAPQLIIGDSCKPISI